MSRKDFVLIAATIANLNLDKLTFATEAGKDLVKQVIAEEFAAALRGTNANFDKGRFIAAATAK